ncbi:LysR family transcriptional regulator [Consotaella aegiceratis]|uniref:LysR family transcriptional regulator n=1 Tax=Consotaella aegiceratis TaxID=3097961 RepID=UPI002F3F69B1
MRLLVSRHLENFLALYDARNMHAAAETKAISQPALTKSLRLLEQDLGVELFVRTHKGLQPTEAGDALHRYACAIEQEARFASMDIGNIHGQFGGKVRIGIGPVLATSLFPAVLVDIHQQFPTMEVTVETGISSQLVDGLTRDHLDLAVTALPEQPLPEKYVGVPVAESDMIVVGRKGHPLGRQADVGLEDLVRFERVGFFEDREFEKKSLRALGPFAQAMRPILQTTSLFVMFEILAQTDYYAIVSSLILPRAQREGLDRLSVRHDFWTIDIELLCKSYLLHSKPIAAVRSGLLKSLPHSQGKVVASR